jgi:hypothetical protein
MTSYIWWGISTCSSLKVNRCFGGTCRLHLQGRRISQVRNQHEAGSNKSSASCWLLALLIFRPWRWRRHAPPKCRLSFNGLHSFMFQKIGLHTLLYNSPVRAQAVGCWHVTTEARVQSRVISYKDHGGQSGTGAGFSSSFLLSPSSHHSSIAPYSSVITPRCAIKQYIITFSVIKPGTSSLILYLAGYSLGVGGENKPVIWLPCIFGKIKIEKKKKKELHRILINTED